MTLGTKIRNLRTIQDYSQENMAEMLGLSVNSYSKIERDEVNPTLKRLEEIASVLKMTVVDMLSFGENGVIFNTHFKSDTGSYVGNSVVYANPEFAMTVELEKLKIENESLRREITHLKEMVELLKAQSKS